MALYIISRLYLKLNSPGSFHGSLCSTRQRLLCELPQQLKLVSAMLCCIWYANTYYNLLSLEEEQVLLQLRQTLSLVPLWMVVNN